MDEFDAMDTLLNCIPSSTNDDNIYLDARNFLSRKSVVRRAWSDRAKKRFVDQTSSSRYNFR